MGPEELEQLRGYEGNENGGYQIDNKFELFRN
jgi:hypothetical protein